VSPVATKNRSGLQTSLSESVCESEEIEAGDHVSIRTSDKGILIWPREKRNEAFTIGYEGRTTESFITKLQSKGIKQVIDVREVPLSRKKGFSKNALAEALALKGIGYVHMPRLGSPKAIRDEYKAGGSPEHFFQEYSDYVEGQQEELMKLLQLILGKKSALMCFEESHKACHRSILAKKLSEQNILFMHL